MNKKNIIKIFIPAFIMIIISLVLVFFSDKIYDFFSNNTYIIADTMSEYKSGEYSDNNYSIKLRLKLSNDNSISEVEVYEYAPKSDIVDIVIQRLVNKSIDKFDTYEIEDEENYKELSNVYKNAIDMALGNEKEENVEEVENVSLSMTDEEVLKKVVRKEVDKTRDSVKTGLGSYIINNFTDSERNKSGNLSTHEYICGVMIDQNGRIIDVKFDHISSNINYDSKGEVPTGSARAYHFISDKEDKGFSGYCTDGNYINILDLERIVKQSRFLAEARRVLPKNKGYEQFLKALENAIENARYIGANKDDMMGISNYKELNKKDIKNAEGNQNGSVRFISNYLLLTTNKDLNITSAIVDYAYNDVVLTSDGKIFGTKNSQVYTVLELTNEVKYTRVNSRYLDIKEELNEIGELIKGNTATNFINEISKDTDDKGKGLEGTSLEKFTKIDFIKLANMLSNAYIDSRKIS